MERGEWKLTVTWNRESSEFDIRVEPDNVFVGLSLVGPADRVLRRVEARAEAAQAMRNAPRVFPAGLPMTKGPLG
jgi:hypothetical protein